MNRGAMALCCIFILAAWQPARSGAWTQKKNGYYLKFSANYLTTDKERNFTGQKFPIFHERLNFTNATFQEANATLYFEYGLASNLTVIASLPLKSLRAERTELGAPYFESRRISTTTVGFGDLTLAVRYPLFVAPFVASIQSGVRLPMGYDQNPNDGGPPLGSGEVDAEGHLLVGASLYPFYVTGGIGYRRRGGVYHDEIVYAGEIGWQKGRWLMKVVTEGIENTMAPQDVVGTPIVTPIPGGQYTVIIGDQNVTKLNPGLAFQLKPGLAINGELFHIVAGKNTISGTTFSLGLVLTR